MPLTLRVGYFAILREQRGLSHETLVTEHLDAASVYEELRARHGLQLPRERIRVSINGEMAPWPAPVSSGDELVFIPPISGG
jgi:molybdopterin synthase sulfur carrier subunit